MTSSKRFSIDVVIVTVGHGAYAVTVLGGVRVRGARGVDEFEATRNLLFALSGAHNVQRTPLPFEGDAELALEMALSGTHIDTELAALNPPEE